MRGNRAPVAASARGLLGLDCDHLAVGHLERLGSSPSPTAPPPLRTIGIGESAEGTLSSSHPADEFDLTVIADGILVVRLRWDVAHISTIPLLKIGDAEFRSRPPDWSPVVARVPATRGRQYRLRVAAAGIRRDS